MYGPNQPLPLLVCEECAYCMGVEIITKSLHIWIGSTCLSYGYLVLAWKSGGERGPY